MSACTQCQYDASGSFTGCLYGCDGHREQIPETWRAPSVTLPVPSGIRGTILYYHNDKLLHVYGNEFDGTLILKEGS
jgi:hypothetical protein